MDEETFLTPRKIFQNAFNAARKSTTGTGSPSVAVYTPKSLSRTAAGTGRFNLLPVMQTPPSRLVNGKVINPFEAHLAERLHLPLICSPSLFHRPSTPHSGNPQQFEWTIDEVSYLGPANVEPHETQFMDTPDPVLEAKAQAAISAYFSEQNIVPSPIDCQLRKQKIILNSDCSENISFVGRSSKRKRDGITQTVLTFPPILPREIEELLAPFCSYHNNQQQNHAKANDSDASIDHEARDASLRRKLFNCMNASTATGSDRDDSLEQLDLRSLSPAPVTPELDKGLVQNLKRSRCFGSQEIQIAPGDISISPVVAKESFGALSPISKSSTSPSPMKPASNSTELPDHDAIYRSTPEKPNSTVFQLNCSSVNSHHMSVELSESFRGEKHADTTVEFTEEELSYEDKAFGSSQSTSSVSQHPTTPLRHTSREKRCNRKNLSRSFLLYSDEDRLEEENEEQQLLVNELPQRSFSVIGDTEKGNILPTTTTASDDGKRVTKSPSRQIGSGHFYRMDSGFNDEETRGSQETVDYCETDVSMQSECCESRSIPRMLETVSDGQHHTGCTIRL
ncbi:protein aurora borealis [Topomyia yanbarensis]|uniref:protein aurora borealis n=1 Tax=Topomyia yanbarensis TaxID=2498891 RepID=UPI00273B2164|nr:protein aurora borealis [Topomyia yanbarensis]